MNSAVFHTLLKNSSSINSEEMAELREWSSRFGYCQIIHLLLARGARDLRNDDAQALLHRAAVYAGDRTVVKSVVTAPVKPRVVVPVIKEVKKATQKPSVSGQTASDSKLSSSPESALPSKEVPPKVIPVSTEIGDSISLEGDALRADLTSELHRLHHLMSAFEASYEQLKQNESSGPQPKLPKKPSAKATLSAETPEAPLIEEIKSSKRKPKLVSPKVAEQGEIIDHFIKVAPTLPRTKPSEPSADLAAESVHYGDHIVSETLVEILLKQGKKAKAIEMLKKLIWKFPQKKAYFAAQIEALKS
jgi:hypothetical protein